MQIIDHSKIPDIEYSRGDFKFFMSDIVVSSDQSSETDF